MKRTRHALFLSLVALWALVVAPVLWQPARAQDAPPTVTEGIELYNDLEYTRAALVLEKALAEPGLSKETLTEGYRTLALSYIALGRDDEARIAFRKLLKANRDYQLPRTESQRARDLFDEVEQSMPRPKVIRPVQISQTASPAEPTPGRPVNVSIVVSDPSRRLSKVIVFHRQKGQTEYSSITALQTGAGRFSIVIPGTFVNPPAIEYYVAAHDREGVELASEGTALEPLTLPVGEVERSAPLYTRWWFWASVAGVVAAATLTGIALAGGGSGGSEDATVNVTVDYTP